MQYAQNFLFVLRFLGTNYHGWQIQENALSIQEVFQNALFKVIKHRTDVKGCSRTDSGVHANSYCASARININIEPRNLVLAMNTFLPYDIKVIKCIKVEDSFHARYSCRAKEYIYKLYNCRVMDPFMVGRSLHFWYNLDIRLMNILAKCFIGNHDFSSFCSLDRRETKKMDRNIFSFDIYKLENIVYFKIKADGFLYNMVRIIVGTILEANYRKTTIEGINKIIKSKNRQLAGPTVPACGLYLNRIFYDRFII